MTDPDLFRLRPPEPGRPGDGRAEPGRPAGNRAEPGRPGESRAEPGRPWGSRAESRGESRAESRVGPDRPVGDRLVGLDELLEPPDWAAAALSVRDEPLPLSPFRDRRWWLRKLLLAVVVATLAFGLLRLARLSVPYLLLVLIVLAVSLLRHALREVAAEPLPDAVTGRNVDRSAAGNPDRERLRPSVMASDGLAFAVGRWDDRLAWSERDPDRFHVLMVPRLRELIDERLRLRHGLTIAGDPERSRELLGDDLWRLLHASRGATGKNRLGAAGLASIVTRLEKL